jgi:hypothetical protein
MTGEEYISRLRNVTDLIQSEHPAIMQKMGLNALSLIKRRISTTGTNAEGQLFRPYSKTYLAYKKEQGKLNTLGDFVDFSFTGRMWRNTTLVASGQNTVTIGPKADENMEKMRKNVKSRGPIMQLSEKELSQIKDSYRDEIMKLFTKAGLNFT